MATTEERIRQLADEHLATEEGQRLSLDVDITDEGVSSVAGVAFVRLVGRELNVELPPEDVSEMRSLRDLINYRDGKINS